MFTCFEADRTNIYTEPRHNAFLSILDSCQPTTNNKTIKGEAGDVYRKNRKKGVKRSDLIGRPFFQFLLRMTVDLPEQPFCNFFDLEFAQNGHLLDIGIKIMVLHEY